jgi:flagellar biogenesis protein FliO
VEFISQFAAVIAVLALAAGATWALRRGGLVRLRGTGRQGIVEVIESRPITQHLSVHVIRIRGNEMVLAVHITGVTVLAGKPELSKAVGP